MLLQSHSTVLHDAPVTLRPLTERDWGVVIDWAADPEVLFYSEGDDVSTRTLDEVQQIFRHISQSAFCFVVENAGDPVGSCWLQEMNLDRLKVRYPNLDCRRIDLELARPHWGKGIGGVTLRLLLRFAFDQEHADAVFGCDVADFNARSRRLFERAGFDRIGTNSQPTGKSRETYDYCLMRHAQEEA